MIVVYIEIILLLFQDYSNNNQGVLSATTGRKIVKPITERK